MNNVSAAEYQRFRLWAGISSITLNMALAWGLYFAAPRIEGLLSFLPFALQVVVVIEAGLLLLLPFDILTGHAAEAWSGRSLQSFTSWLLDWLLVATRSLVMASVGGFWLGHSYFMDWPLRLMWGWMFFLGILLFALSIHTWGARRWRIPRHPDAAYAEEVLRELRTMGGAEVELHWVRETDSNSVNITPLSFLRLKLALSSNIIDHFSPREAALLIWRENWHHQTNRRLISLVICMVWLLSGQFLAWFIPAGTLLEAALGGMAVFSSWCLIALFVWPTLNRIWCADADRSMLKHASLEETSDLLRKVQELNATDLSLGSGKTAIFHPIPPLNERLRSLRRMNAASPNPPQAEQDKHRDFSEKEEKEELV